MVYLIWKLIWSGYGLTALLLPFWFIAIKNCIKSKRWLQLIFCYKFVISCTQLSAQGVIIQQLIDCNIWLFCFSSPRRLDWMGWVSFDGMPLGSAGTKVRYLQVSTWACHLSTDVAAGQPHFYGSLMALLGLYERTDS